MFHCYEMLTWWLPGCNMPSPVNSKFFARILFSELVHHLPTSVKRQSDFFISRAFQFQEISHPKISEFTVNLLAILVYDCA